MLWSTGGKERGKTSGEVDTPNARLFTRVWSILSNTTCLLKTKKKKIVMFIILFFNSKLNVHSLLILKRGRVKKRER